MDGGGWCKFVHGLLLIFTDQQRYAAHTCWHTHRTSVNVMPIRESFFVLFLLPEQFLSAFVRTVIMWEIMNMLTKTNIFLTDIFLSDASFLWMTR